MISSQRSCLKSSRKQSRDILSAQSRAQDHLQAELWQTPLGIAARKGFPPNSRFLAFPTPSLIVHEGRMPVLHSSAAGTWNTDPMASASALHNCGAEAEARISPSYVASPKFGDGQTQDHTGLEPAAPSCTNRATRGTWRKAPHISGVLQQQEWIDPDQETAVHRGAGDPSATQVPSYLHCAGCRVFFRLGQVAQIPGPQRKLHQLMAAKEP